MRTILLVDDETDIRKKNKRLLVAAGFRVVDVPSALDVANILMREKSNLDLVVLDLNLPEVDGRGIFEIITEYAPNLDIMVNSVFPISEQKSRIPRAVAYHDKSQGGEILVEKVCNLLGVEAKVK